MFERIIVNQIEILLDSQAQDDFDGLLPVRYEQFWRRIFRADSG